MDISRFNFQEAPCGLFVFDSNLKIVAANQTLATMLGFSLDELNNKSLNALLTSAERLMFHMQVMALLHLQGRVEEIAIILAGADGKNIPVIFNAVQRNIDGNVVTECVVVRMNERKRLEEELLRVKKATEQVPGTIYQFLLRADGSSCFPYASEGVRNVYELNPLQLQKDASPAFNRLHPDDIEAINQGIADSAKNLTVWHQEYRVILPKRGIRWLQGSATPESRVDGSTLWHGYINDITEKKP
ncbi:PAS domain-containing protein [Janthinobacterium sp. CAN_S7]|uniref:PAS domain-containing protein n=1 Tax=Janthinobacterium sp. CAN_S7 TaxID=3071704 RepID=UPI00319E8392